MRLQPDAALCVNALESLLVEKGLVGALTVARTWSDPPFRERRLSDARGALEEMGLPRLEATDQLEVANTPTRHNLVECSLCSCYRWGLLGLLPT